MLAGRRAQAWRHQPAFRRPRHFHDEPEINLVTRGSCVLGVGDRRLLIERGQLAVLQPGQDHELLEATPDLGLFVFALRAEYAERALGSRRLTGLEVSEVSAARLLGLEEELSALGALRDAVSGDARVAEMFAEAVDRAPKAHAISRRVLESLQADQSLSESTLARRLRTNSSGISREFRRALGVPLVEYRARIRLMRFIELVDGGETLSRAALGADFGSYAQCHRVFRRALRCSPREYFEGLRLQRNDETAKAPTAPTTWT